MSNVSHKMSSTHGKLRPATPNQRRDMIFVFGSNTAGIHGAGAARAALLQHGAVFGEGEGHFGNSYAIPTKEGIKRKDGQGGEIRDTLPLVTIRQYVENFIRYARQHPELKFQITQLGCGLAGLRPEWVAPMFEKAPENCYYDTQWQPYLPERKGDHYRFWGSF